MRGCSVSSQHTSRSTRIRDKCCALNGGLSFHRMRDRMVVEGELGIDFAMLKYAWQHKLLPY
jgi:hypothetical protein